MSASGALDPSAAAAVLARQAPAAPLAFLVLGSGLSGLADALEDRVEVPFTDLPGFPPAGVPGHRGRFVHGRLAGVPVLVQAGRFHLYEGHALEVVTAPVRVAHEMGIGTLLLTNAAGGLDRRLGPGSLMLIEDHLTLGMQPMLRSPSGRGERLLEAYDGRLCALARRVAAEQGIALSSGVYASVPGPSYETPAEVRMLARAGADAVGMSTVPEAVAAWDLGMATLAISLITNAAAGLVPGVLSHDEVMAVGREGARTLTRLLTGIVRGLA